MPTRPVRSIPRKRLFFAVRRPGPRVFSSLTAWEGPDPVWWVGQG
ncbi:hypothetical protein ACFXG6_27485 [Streptomyces roseus]